MNIELKYLAAIVLVSAALGAGITRVYATREVIKTQIVEKTVTVDRDVVKDHNVIVTKEIVNKDGSKETDTIRTEDHSGVETKKTTDDKNTEIVDTKASNQKQWFVSAGAGIDPHDGFTNFANPIYQVNVSRRILGPVYLGVWGTSKSQVGVTAGFEF